MPSVQSRQCVIRMRDVSGADLLEMIYSQPGVRKQASLEQGS